jgi:hypothetical protein
MHFRGSEVLFTGTTLRWTGFKFFFKKKRKKFGNSPPPFAHHLRDAILIASRGIAKDKGYVIPTAEALLEQGIPLQGIPQYCTFGGRNVAILIH